MTVSRRVLALISTLALSRESIGHRGGESLELLAGVAVHAEHEHPPLATQLVYPRAVMARHRQDQIGLLHQLARQQPRAMSGEIETPLEAHEIGALGCGCTIPRPGPGRRHLHFETALLQGALEQ